jgi:hypothetical protein
MASRVMISYVQQLPLLPPFFRLYLGFETDANNLGNSSSSTTQAPHSPSNSAGPKASEPHDTPSSSTMGRSHTQRRSQVVRSRSRVRKLCWLNYKLHAASCKQNGWDTGSLGYDMMPGNDRKWKGSREEQRLLNMAGIRICIHREVEKNTMKISALHTSTPKVAVFRMLVW